MRILFVYFFFYNWMASSQPKFETMPEGAKEIHFTYTRSLNMKLNEEGLFADTLFIKYVLKSEAFEIRNSEKNATEVIGFIPLKEIEADFNLYNNLKSHLYHTNETYYGIYYVTENRTVIKAIRGDADSRFIFTTFFKESFEPFEYTVEYNFKTATRKLNFPTTQYENNLYEKIQNITESDNETIGFTQEIEQGIEYKNIIIMDTTLSPFISPAHYNASYGITKVKSIKYTINLIAVNYR